MAIRLGPTLHVGEDLVGKGAGEKAKRGARAAAEGEGGGEALRRNRGKTSWEGLGTCSDDDFQEPQDAIPFRERKLSSLF